MLRSGCRRRKESVSCWFDVVWNHKFVHYRCAKRRGRCGFCARASHKHHDTLRIHYHSIHLNLIPLLIEHTARMHGFFSLLQRAHKSAFSGNRWHQHDGGALCGAARAKTITLNTHYYYSSHQCSHAKKVVAALTPSQCAKTMPHHFPPPLSFRFDFLVLFFSISFQIVSLEIQWSPSSITMGFSARASSSTRVFIHIFPAAFSIVAG